MPLEGASADVEASEDHVVDAGSLQQVRQILGGIVRETVADGKDTERVGVFGKGEIGILFLRGQA